MPEILDLYDADMRPLNRTVIRGEPIPQGCYHIVVIIMTVSPRTGKILMTKRAPEKSRSGMWEITGGSKQAGVNVTNIFSLIMFQQHAASFMRKRASP